MFGIKTNRNWNLLRKFWNLHIKISIENWLFTHLPGPLSFYTALENKTIYLQQFFRFRGEGKLPPPPCGRPWFFCIFFNKFNKPFVKFLRVWTKNANRGKFWKTFRKLRKMHYFCILQQNLKNHAVIFQVWTKNTNC